jgi:tetratricopeptide (TPR) repeat protein
MNKFLNDDFMWQYERFLLAYDAFIYMGRAYQLLAETSDREKSEDYWRQCFIYVGKAKGLLSDPEARKNETVREICTRALLYEMKARVAYGDIKRGQTAIKQYADAAKLAEDFFKAYPNARFEETGKAVRLEQARVYCKSGQLKKGVDLLQELSKQYRDTWVENIAVDILGEYGADASPALAVEAANNFFERGPAFLYKAMQKYRKALAAIKKAEDQKYVSECWYQIGRCYYYLDRYYEAVQALSVLEKAPLSATKEAPQAAMLKLQSLQRIAKVTKDKADEKALEDFRGWVTKTYPTQAGAQLIRQSAIDAEVKQNFAAAIEEWSKLVKPGTEIYEEAVFSLGFARFREGDRLFDQAAKQRVAADRDKLSAQGLDQWTKALSSFKEHLAFVDKMTTKDAKAVKNAVGSLMFSCRILVHEKVNKAEEALALSDDVDKRFPTADPKLVIAIMSLRIDAKVKKGMVEEAEDDLKALKAKYDKEGLGLDHYQRALTVLAGAFMAQAAKEKEKNPEKYDLYGMKATEYYYQFYQLNPSAIKGNVDQMEAMAQMLFSAAEARLKAGQAKGEKDQVDEAKKIYARCHELYKEYLLARERELEKSDKGKEIIRGIKARVTRCLLMAGQFEEAIKMYEDVTRNDATMRDGSSWEELADCYAEKARSLPKGAERNDLLRRCEKIYAQLATLLIQNQRFDEHAYRLLYKRGEALFELDLDALRSFYNNATVRGWAPKWDADEKNVSRWGFQTRFEELRKRLDAVLPPKK